MKIELDISAQANNRIDSYDKGLIIINGTSYTSSLIVTPEKLIADWGPECSSDLATQHLNQIISLSPEIIIIGTGQHSIFPAQELISPVFERGIGIEIMDTGAACRCYNLLVSENRSVAAGLFQI